MEIKITKLFYADTWSVSGSVATHGADASKRTWAAAKDMAEDKPVLVEPEELQALRDHVQAMGFDDDVQAYGEVECNALLAQLVAGDKREMGADVDTENFDWDAYEADEDASHLIFKASDGEVYYYLGD